MSGIGRAGSSPARTGAKHALLDSVVGALAGMATLPAVREKFPGGQVMVDMTAGDIVGGPGGPTPGTLFDVVDIAPDATASHAILSKHAAWTASRTGQTPRIYLFEKEPAQAARLAQHYADDCDVVVTCGRSDERLRYVVPIMHRGSLLLVDDPNSTGSSTLTTEVVDWAFGWSGTTLIACMGVNAGGVAKNPDHYPASREQYQRVLDAAQAQGGRYAAAARLRGDSHRWGYLVITTKSASRAVDDAIARMRNRTSFPVEPALGFRQVEQMLDALHTPRGATA